METLKSIRLLLLTMTFSLGFSSCGDGDDSDIPTPSSSDNTSGETSKDHSGSFGGRSYVDLGLPSGTLWAASNIGASNDSYGGYFAWAETTTKNTYTWKTYKYCGGSNQNINKYCTSRAYGDVDGLRNLYNSDDAAYVNWGEHWRLPTVDQIEELINSSYTTITWTTLNDVQGLLITSNTNKNTIFLPAAGYHYDGSLESLNTSGCYWTRQLHYSLSSQAYALVFNSNSTALGNTDRCYGRSIRAVFEPSTD